MRFLYRSSSSWSDSSNLKAFSTVMAIDTQGTCMSPRLLHGTPADSGLDNTLKVNPSRSNFELR